MMLFEGVSWGMMESPSSLPASVQAFGLAAARAVGGAQATVPGNAATAPFPTSRSDLFESSEELREEQEVMQLMAEVLQLQARLMQQETQGDLQGAQATQQQIVALMQKLQTLMGGGQQVPGLGGGYTPVEPGLGGPLSWGGGGSPGGAPSASGGSGSGGGQATGGDAPATTGGAGDAAGPDGGAHGAAAQSVAEEMAGFKYQFYYDDKKSNAQTQSQKSGNCCDLAQVAVAKMKAKGLDAHIVLGDIKSRTYNGGHYWVSYKEPGSNKWSFFDPTAAATNHSAAAAFRGLRATYKKR